MKLELKIWILPKLEDLDKWKILELFLDCCILQWGLINLDAVLSVLLKVIPYNILIQIPLLLFQFIIISSILPMYKSCNLNNTTNSTILKSTQDNTINMSMMSLHESQAEAIQREIDNYTGKLQQQKRKFFSIQDSHKEVLKQHENYKLKLQESKRISQTSDTIINHAKLKNLKGNFDKMRVAYDQTIAYNYKLKTEIDKLRRDKKILMNLQNTYVQQISRKEEEYRGKLYEVQQKKQKNQDILNEIDQIKMINEEQKDDCNRRINDIQNQYSQSKKIREMSKLNQKSQKTQIIDTHPVLKLRLKKIIAKNKQTVKSLDKYQKNLTMIENAFNEIKEGSGVQDLEEITETFIKMSQQNASLYKYADTISRNIRSLEEYNSSLVSRISEQTEINRQKQQNAKNPSVAELKRKELELQLKQKSEYISNFNKLLSNIQPQLEKTLVYLANSKWNLEPMKAEEYKLDFNVTDSTIEQYLSDLQKYSNTIIQIYHLKNNTRKSITESYVSEGGKHSHAPSYSIEEGREEKDRDLLAQKDLKKFAEEYLATQKKYKTKQ